MRTSFAYTESVLLTKFFDQICLRSGIKEYFLRLLCMMKNTSLRLGLTQFLITGKVATRSLVRDKETAEYSAVNQILSNVWYSN